MTTVHHSTIPSVGEVVDQASSSLAARSNPLHGKITNVLATSYADSDVRDALALLDQRGLENTAESRRRLRLDVEKEVIESNGDIIREFGHVAEVNQVMIRFKNLTADTHKQLKRIGLTIASLNQGCEEMKKHISAAHQETAPLLEESAALVKQKQQVEARQQLLRAFNAHFILSDDEIAALTSAAEPVDDRFFSHLIRAKKIQKDCEILLGTESQRLGLEIMEKISNTLNGAFQKLYRWIQREFKTLNLESPQINASIRKALRVLAERPALFQSCLDFFAEARENILTDSFYTALTGNSVEGVEDTSVKPIELVAHDPLRYVGDMLAWTHSATVSEREALEVLFISEGDEIAKGIQAGRDSEPWNRISEDEGEINFDGVTALNGLVDRDVAGVARVLKQRISQVIQSHEETIMAYKISNLLNFYRVTFTKLLGESSALLESLSSLEEAALRQFRVLMKDHVAGLQGDALAAPSDLSPPGFLQDGLKQLNAIMKVYDISLTTEDSRATDFQPILAEAFDPFMKASEIITNNLQEPFNSIFGTNCLLAARSVLAAFDFNAEKVQEIQNIIDQYAANLVSYQYTFFLDSSGIKPLLTALAPFSEDPNNLSTLRNLEPFQPESLIQVSEKLDDFLPSALMDALENLTALQNNQLVRDITEQASEKFCTDFESVEEKLIAADEQLGLDEEVQPLRTLFPRTSGEIRVLLS